MHQIQSRQLALAREHQTLALLRALSRQTRVRREQVQVHQTQEQREQVQQELKSQLHWCGSDVHPKRYAHDWPCHRQQPMPSYRP